MGKSCKHTPLKKYKILRSLTLQFQSIYILEKIILTLLMKNHHIYSENYPPPLLLWSIIYFILFFEL